MFRTPENGFFPDFLSDQNMVRVTEAKLTVSVCSSSREVRVSEGSSYRESTIYERGAKQASFSQLGDCPGSIPHRLFFYVVNFLAVIFRNILDFLACLRGILPHSSWVE